MFHIYIKNFPKTEKYGLGQKIETLILEMLELTFNALSSSNDKKVIAVQKLSNKNDLLKLLIRLCCDIKLINQKRYLRIQSYLHEIGEMIGGWLKSLNN